MKGKGLTIYAGLLPILNFMKRLSFRERIIEGVNTRRAPNARYQLVDAIQMVVIGMIAGATAMEHVATVWKDKVLQRMGGWGDVPVATTLGRIVKKVTLGNVVELEVLVHHFRGRVWKGAIRAGQRLRSALSEMWVDVDSTVEGVFGRQEGAEKGYNPKRKGQKSYHPLMAFVSETKEVLHSWFRCGNAYSGNGIVDFMKECMSHIRGSVRVVFRGDSAFFNGGLFDYLESVGAGFLVKVKFKGLRVLLEGQLWRPVSGSSGWEWAEFQHRCQNWSFYRRFVAVRRLVRVEKGLIDLPEYEYFCYVTTELLAPMEAHLKYGKRATCETWIEEFKGQVGAGNIRTSEFLANSVLFQGAVLAYNILKWMALLTGGIVRQWEVKSIRFWLVRIAGRLVGGGRQLILKLPERFLHQKEWLRWERMSLSAPL
jgi:hypothetical protein